MEASEAMLRLESRARRAYEFGRLRQALRFAPFVAAAAIAALAAGRPLAVVLLVCAALLPLAVGLAFRGGSPGRGVVHGFAAGAAPLALPLLMATVGHACFGPACLSLCQPACIVGGAVAGVVVAKAMARADRDFRFGAAALAIAALTGALGCTVAGLLGVFGMLAGAVAAGTPILVAARR